MIDLYLWGEISEGTSRLLVDDILSATEEIRLFICSPGGEIEQAAAILDAIHLCSQSVTTVVIGQACSAAALIFLVGQDRICTPCSFLHFHPLYFGLPEGYLAQQVGYTVFTEGYARSLYQTVSERAKISPHLLHDLIREHCWVSSQEAYLRGLANRVLI